MSNTATSATVRRSERRHCFRRKVLEHGEIIPVDLGPMESGMLLDVSARGVGVQGLKPLRPGVRISVKFRLPGSQASVQPTYEVVWTTPDGRVGLKFLYIAEREQRLLDEWAAIHLPQEALETPPHAEHFEPAAAAPPKPAAAAELITMTLEEELARVVRQASTYTSADGAAVALREGQGIVCRASWGNAPDIGVALNPDAGLSGECIRSGALVNCSDATCDPHVDPVAAQQLNLRSILIVPIILNGRVEGLIEVLSSRAGAFTPAHVKSLERLAEIVGFLVGPPGLAGAPVAPGPTPVAETAAPASQAAPEVRVESPPRLPIAAAEQPPRTDPAVQPPAAPAPDAATAAPADIAGLLRLIEPELAAPSAPPVVQNTPAAAVVGMPAFDLRLEVPAFARPSARVRRPKWALFAFLAVCAVLATAGGWFLGVRKAPSTPPQAQGETVAAPAASTAPPEKAVPLAPSKTSARSKSAPPAAALAAEPEAEVVTWIRGDTGSSSSNTAKDDGETAAPPVVGLPQTNAQLAAIPTGSPAAPRAPAAPARAVEANAAPLRVLPQTMLARAVHRVTPDYPPEARQAGIAGSVDLLVIVGTDGKVEMAAPVSGPPVLAVAAAKALKQWRFQPYAPDAKPLRVETTITVVFRRP